MGTDRVRREQPGCGAEMERKDIIAGQGSNHTEEADCNRGRNYIAAVWSGTFLEPGIIQKRICTAGRNRLAGAGSSGGAVCPVSDAGQLYLLSDLQDAQ